MKNLFIFAITMGMGLAGFAQTSNSTKTAKITLRGTSVPGNEPLIVINGNKQYIRGTSPLNQINPENIQSINVLKDSSAVAKYGNEGLAGVIEVTTKNSPFDKQSTITEPKPADETPLKGKVTGFTVRPQNSQAQDGINNFSVTKNGIKIKSGKTTPLYIIDGTEATGIENVDPKDIESVTVLKDASAASEYGEKGKNGVVIVTTKKTSKTKKN